MAENATHYPDCEFVGRMNIIEYKICIFFYFNLVDMPVRFVVLSSDWDSGERTSAGA